MDLAELLNEFRDVDEPRLLVGFGTSDDAGVYQLDEETALVQTADVITPVCNDPYVFGQVAAANSMSDVYAMGGAPLTAVNLAFFPDEGVPVEVLKEVLRGARDKVREAGAVIVGGHTVRDAEIKFGLAVTGTIDPQLILRNSLARPGEALVLTKPLGTGVMIAGHRADWIDDEGLQPALEQMVMLNDVAARLALAHDAHAATDVTGFGLGGHAGEMARGSRLVLQIWYERLPRFERALELIERGASTAVTADNRRSVEDIAHFDDDLSETELTLLFDPQTSGGLLVSLPWDRAEQYVERLRGAGLAAAEVVGEVVPSAGKPGLEVIRGAPQGSPGAAS